jgi:hypothetical protein
LGREPADVEANEWFCSLPEALVIILNVILNIPFYKKTKLRCKRKVKSEMSALFQKKIFAKVGVFEFGTNRITE